jgi:hypothetical protein
MISKITFLHAILYTGITAGALLLAGCGDSGFSRTVEFPDAPDDALRLIATEISQANGGILWQAMPASYQNDVNELVHLASEKLDAEIYDQSFELVDKLTQIASEKKDFILNASLMGEPMFADEKAEMEEAWPAIVVFLNTLNSSQITSIKGLRSFDGQDFCNKTVSELLQQLDRLVELSGEEFRLEDLSKIAVEVVEANEDGATLEVSMPGEIAETITYTKVEGRWLDEDIVNSWAEGVALAKANLIALTPDVVAENKQQVLATYSVVDGILANLLNAKTQEQFDLALAGAMGPLMGLMMMGEGLDLDAFDL